MQYINRMEKARGLMEQEGVDLLVLTHSSDLRYLTGIYGHLMERLTCLLLSRQGCTFLLPSFEMGNLPEEVRGSIDCHGWSDGDDPYKLVQIFCGKPRKVAVGGDIPAWMLLNLMKCMPEASWVQDERIMPQLRLEKDEAEFALLKRVQEKACSGLEKLVQHGLGGLTEAQAYRLLTQFCAEEGVTVVGGIVGAGPNSALPHHNPGDRVIRNGDPVCIDFVGEEPEIGYKADTTRTYCVGKIPDGFRSIYEVVQEANEAAFAAVQVGVPCEEVDRAARAVIERAGYGGNFTHRLGHGLGLDTHEAPYMCRGNTMPIRPGFVFSDEPGIYLTGQYGVRIEDQIFVTAQGPVRLTPMAGLLSHELKICD